MVRKKLLKSIGCVSLSTLVAVTMVPACASTSQGTGQSTAQQTGGTGQPSGGSSQNAGSGADTQTYDYSGTYSGVLTADGTSKTATTGKTYSTSTADQNVLLAQNSGTLTAKGVTLNKSGDDTDGDNCNFYGVNSGVLAVGSGTKLYLSNSSLKTTSAGSNGIFATDSAKIYANNDTITTTSSGTSGGNARGLDATYGGTIIGNRLTISTKGDHCAALATDRGGGNISVTNSSLETAGSGSPLLYSTGAIEVENVTGTASGSQIAGMEGLNTIYISNSKLTSTSDAKSGSDPIKDGVILYQSTSGDADTSTGSTASFSAKNSTLKTAITSGAFFYVTNTTADVVLKNTTLSTGSSSVDLLNATGNSNNWGTAGSNGATVNFTLNDETVSGDITADTISTANVYLLNGTKYTGSTSITENSSASSTSDAPITMNVDSSSTWVVDGDSTVTNLNVEKGGKIVDSSGKTVSIVVNGTKKVSGTSSYTVTVTDSYSTSVSTGSSNKISSASISRSAFDSYYGTSTTMGTNEKSTGSSSSTVKTGTKFTKGKLKYKVTSKKTVTVTGLSSGYKKSCRTLTIPSKVSYKGKTYQVTSIAAKAFYNNRKLKTVTIGSKVKKIGASAFAKDTKIKKLTIKTKKLILKSVGGKAFLKTGTSVRMTVKVPSGKVKSYRTILKKRGAGAKLTVKA